MAWKNPLAARRWKAAAAWLLLCQAGLAQGG